jgi:hypothetical protein
VDDLETILDRHFVVRLERIRGESSGFAAMLRNRCTVQASGESKREKCLSKIVTDSRTTLIEESRT